MTSFFNSGTGYEVICCLEKAGYEAVYVGGAVRDYILGREAKDIDIATSAEPHEVKAIFSNTVDVGIAHGTVLVVYKGEPIEVTTYRTEGTYSDHRRPDEVKFVKSLKEDLRRRDFTMNAVAMTIDGEVIDPFDGKQDMDEHLICAVGNPADRFKEDALRMFRAIRFASVLNFSIEDKTFLAIVEGAEQISHVSTERLKIEMDKLFMGINPVNAFKYLEKSKLHAYLPLYPNQSVDLTSIVPFTTPLEGWAFITLIGNFSSAEMAKAYKLSNSERTFLSSVRAAYNKRVNNLFTINDYYQYSLDVLLTTEKIVRSVYKDFQSLTNEEIKLRKSSLPITSITDLVIDGKNLIDWTGLPGGKWTGEWLKKIEIAVLHGKCKNDFFIIREWFINEFNS